MAGIRVALLIATDAYTDSAFSQLRAPQHDATALAEVLRDKEIGGYQVGMLVNEQSQEIRVRINELFTQAGREDLVLLYLSGHGIKDETGRLHIASTDTRRSLLASTAIPAQWIRELIDHSPARQIVVWLDCCYGGAFPAGMIPKAAGTVDVVPQLATRGRGCAVMTASTHIQFAFEHGNRVRGTTQPSVFTSAIVEGLRTGDADRNADGQIDANELYSYVHEKVTAGTPNQTPTRNDQVTGEIYIASSKRGVPLHPDLPVEIKQTLRSTRADFRLVAVDLLARLARSADPAERTIAADTLNQLRSYPDPLLAMAAAQAARNLDRAQPTRQPAEHTPLEPPLPFAPIVLEPSPQPAKPPERSVSAAPAPSRRPRKGVSKTPRLSRPGPPTASEPIGAVRPASAPVKLELPRHRKRVGVRRVLAWFALTYLFIIPVGGAFAEYGGPREQTWVIVGSIFAPAFLGSFWMLGLSLYRLFSRSAALPTNSGGTNEVVFHPEGKAVVCAGSPGTASAWDTSSWTELVAYSRGMTEVGYNAAFSRDGTILATTHLTYTGILDWDRRELIAELGAYLAESLVFSPDGTMLAGAAAAEIRIFNTADWTLLKTLTGHAGRVTSLAFNPDGTVLASASLDTNIKLWNTAEWVQFTTLTAHNHGVRAVAFSSSGDTLASSDSVQIKFWDPGQWIEYRRFNNRLSVSGALAICPVGPLLAYGCWASGIKLVNMTTGSTVRTFIGHQKPVTSLAFSPDGGLLASTSRDGTLRLWPIKA